MAHGSLRQVTGSALPLVRLRVEFVLKGGLLLHHLNGPMIRGSLGTALRDLHGIRGLYEELFDGGQGVRPYRLRSPCTQPPAVVPKGSLLQFEIDLFGPAASKASDLLPAFVIMAHRGFGEGRVPAALHAVAQMLPGTSPVLAARSLTDRPRLRRLPLNSYLPAVEEGICFVSPVRISSRGPLAAPTLDMILKDIARRYAAFTGETIEVPGGGKGEWKDLRYIREARLSSREGEQPLSGVTGILQVDRELNSVARSLLSIGCVMGVGRHTTMGLGDCRPWSP